MKPIIYIILFLLIINFCNAELQIYYTFNETSGGTINDYSGKGNNGMASGTDIISGFLDNARLFNNTVSTCNNYITMPNINYSINNSFTINFLIYPMNNSRLQMYIAKWSSSLSGISYYIDNGVNPYNKLAGGIRNTIIQTYSALSTDTYPENNWSMATFTYNGSFISLYKNGVLTGSNTASGIINYNNTIELYIGRYTESPNYCFYGIIDEFKLYNDSKNSSLIMQWYNDYLDICIPEWQCINYSDCMMNNISECQSVYDFNECNESFIGNFTDYDIACIYPCDNPECLSTSMHTQYIIFIILIIFIIISMIMGLSYNPLIFIITGLLLAILGITFYLFNYPDILLLFSCIMGIIFIFIGFFVKDRGR